MWQERSQEKLSKVKRALRGDILGVVTRLDTHLAGGLLRIRAVIWCNCHISI